MGHKMDVSGKVTLVQMSQPRYPKRRSSPADGGDRLSLQKEGQAQSFWLPFGTLGQQETLSEPEDRKGPPPPTKAPVRAYVRDSWGETFYSCAGWGWSGDKGDGSPAGESSLPVYCCTICMGTMVTELNPTQQRNKDSLLLIVSF